MTVAARDAGPARRRTSAAPARSTKGAARTKPAAKRGRPAAPVAPTRAAVPVVAGILWALALAGAVVLSSFLTAVLVAAVAVLATASAIRATTPKRRSRRRSRRPSTLLLAALASAALDPLVALAGALPALAILAVSGGAIGTMLFATGYAASARPLRAVGARLVAALGPAVAATCVVVARHQGSSLALALVAATLVYDAAAFLMGNTRTPLGGPAGVAAGVASVAVVAVFVAAVSDPPFSGSRPWITFALVALAAPLGVRLAHTVSRERLPALRRVDSLLLAAPVWVLVAALLLHR